MRLYCTLVSSVLFVSVVLADYHPEKQQPPLLDHVEKSLNTTADLEHNWAGAITQVGNFDYAVGTFLVPDARSIAIGPSTFDILVGINSRACARAIISVGITVTAARNTVYNAWAMGFDGNVVEPPQNLVISMNHRITIGVKIESTGGIFWLQNHNTGEEWTDSILGRPDTSCPDQYAAWVVTTSPASVRSLPNFLPVAFMEISTTMPKTVPENLQAGDMYYVSNRQTATMALDNFVTIVRIPQY